MEISWLGLAVVFVAGMLAGCGWGLAAGRGERKPKEPEGQ